jgi:hypothetical protein
LRGDIARGFCLARMGGAPELVIVKNQLEEDRLDSNAILIVFYKNFTTLLRDLYDSVECPWYPLYRWSGYSEGGERYYPIDCRSRAAQPYRTRE